MTPDPNPLLSRVAESVYWMARNIERAENVARCIGVNLNLQLDLPLAQAQQWQPLIDTCGDKEVFEKSYGAATQAGVIEFLAYDPNNPNSICSCLRSARESARSVRETISSEMWAQVNSMYLEFQTQRSMPEPERLLDVFRDIRLGCHLFQGITDATMTHNEAWHFLRLGCKLERADQTSRILDVKYFMLLPSTQDVGTPYDDIHWGAVLKSVSGFEMYRKRFGRISPRDVVDFLVMDRDFPRSIFHCICSANDSLQAITGTSTGRFNCRSDQLLGQLQADLNYDSTDAVIGRGLHEYLDTLQSRINLIDNTIREEFIARTPKRRTQGQSQSQSIGSGLKS